MTMHLEGPWLSTSGKYRGKKKFRSAEEARKAKELEQSWSDIMKKYQPTQVKGKVVKPLTPKPYVRSNGPRIPSLNNGVDVGPALKSPDKVYTGTKIIGIGTMHKSNAVPIFSDTEAKDISSMRR